MEQEEKALAREVKYVELPDYLLPPGVELTNSNPQMPLAVDRQVFEANVPYIESKEYRNNHRELVDRYLMGNYEGGYSLLDEEKRQQLAGAYSEDMLTQIMYYSVRIRGEVDNEITKSDLDRIRERLTLAGFIRSYLAEIIAKKHPDFKKINESDYKAAWALEGDPSSGSFGIKIKDGATLDGYRNNERIVEMVGLALLQYNAEQLLNLYGDEEAQGEFLKL